MRLASIARLLATAALATATLAFAAPKTLAIYAVDVEGGQATLIVSPSGDSLLIDTGWPDNQNRDTRRIQAAMRDAGIERIGHVLITHFHEDHVGGVPNLIQTIPVGEFLDHGVNREDSDDARRFYQAYLKAVEGRNRRILRPGDTIPVAGLTVQVLTADGEHIASIPGVKPQPNPLCATEPAHPADDTENPRSVGVLITFGRFRLLDLGDLTKDKEVALVCPANPLPPIDLYLVTHHGYTLSSSRALVHAIHPRVALMDNGAHKAGSPDAWQTIHESPGLVDLWQLHTAEDSDAAHNSPAELIANPKGDPHDGNWLKVVVNLEGSFCVTNQRTGQSKTYPAR